MGMTNACLDPSTSRLTVLHWVAGRPFGRLRDHSLTTRLFLHMPVILLQAAHLESAVVVFVHEAFDGGGEGGDGGGDRYTADHSLAAHLDLYALRTVSLLVK